jgi:hypothetical protein
LGTKIKDPYTLDGDINTTGSQLRPIIALQCNATTKDTAARNNNGSISFPRMAQQPLANQSLLIIQDLRSHSAAHPHSVGLLWTSHQPDVQNSTWQHTTINRDRYPWPRRDSNLQSQ